MNKWVNITPHSMTMFTLHTYVHEIYHSKHPLPPFTMQSVTSLTNFPRLGSRSQLFITAYPLQLEAPHQNHQTWHCPGFAIFCLRVRNLNPTELSFMTVYHRSVYHPRSPGHWHTLSSKILLSIVTIDKNQGSSLSKYLNTKIYPRLFSVIENPNNCKINVNVDVQFGMRLNTAAVKVGMTVVYTKPCCVTASVLRWGVKPLEDRHALLGNAGRHLHNTSHSSHQVEPLLGTVF